MSDPRGYVSLVLHAHLPFVRHPEHEHFLEEDWLYEAITETYLPIYDVLSRAADDGVKARITMTVSPSLAAMLTDDLLKARYSREIHKLIELAEKEVKRTSHEPAFQNVARHYLDRFRRLRWLFEERLRGDLIAGFREMQDRGVLEIITCAATHGFLPLMQSTPEAVRAQIRVGVEEYRRHFGRQPNGIWLPECGYFPGVERVLAEHGVRFFLVDTHGLLFATPRPAYGPYAPVFTGSGVAAFARDQESSKQVWSSKEGYPGDFHYREFYRDVGWDLDFDYIREYVQPTGLRKNVGIKYYRITGPTDQKEVYLRQHALERAASHAGNFMFNREKQVDWLAGQFPGRRPIVVAPYDAELFGHWWYEGPEFIDYFMRKSAFDQRTYQLATPSDYLRENPANQQCDLGMCTWGDRGYADVWLNGGNDWMYRHLHVAERRMIELARRFLTPGGLERRALNQAARELLLAESSDWAFIVTTNTMVNYAIERFKTHVLRFTRLWEQLCAGRVDEHWLANVEYKDNLFPFVDYAMYR
jgi:1,4-alpha-glucan branching enzyme